MNTLLTPYGEKLDSDCPLPEYPRPQMVRDSYLCLNGTWQYAITSSDNAPTEWDGDILVPFPPESPLSGVGRITQPEDVLWYRRLFVMPPEFRRGRVLLHFGAVDQRCVVFVNGNRAGQHRGGYLPFTVDITDHQVRGAWQELLVMVYDETDLRFQSRGRQRLVHGGEWHTPQSGIWQTVWAECVPRRYVRSLRITPQLDDEAVEVTVHTNEDGVPGSLEVYAGEEKVAGAPFQSGVARQLALPAPICWTPEAPFLYTLVVRAGKDEVKSYFGMRKIDIKPGKNGRKQLMLNNEPYFCMGILDQGLYSDGLYTPPADAAMVNDILFAKQCGFNTLRKHGKIEPLRWYWHCDRLGMLVWQDLPAGGEMPKKRPKRRKDGYIDDDYEGLGRTSVEGRDTFEKEMLKTGHLLYNSPALMLWVLFQNGQGQFDAARLVRVMRTADPTRLIDHASGFYDQGAGDLLSLHLYNYTAVPKLPEHYSGRLSMLTETGGFGLVPTGHFGGTQPYAAALVQNRTVYAEVLTALYSDILVPLVEQGLQGFVYYQLSDAEDEVTGLLSYDRRVQKISARGMASLNRILAGMVQAQNTQEAEDDA